MFCFRNKLDKKEEEKKLREERKELAKQQIKDFLEKYQNDIEEQKKQKQNIEREEGMVNENRTLVS